MSDLFQDTELIISDFRTFKSNCPQVKRQVGNKAGNSLKTGLSPLHQILALVYLLSPLQDPNGACHVSARIQNLLSDLFPLASPEKPILTLQLQESGSPKYTLSLLKARACCPITINKVHIWDNCCLLSAFFLVSMPLCLVFCFF